MDSSRAPEALIARARGGDREAFDQLHVLSREAVEAAVRLQAGGLLRVRVEVEDLVQETFLRAFRSLAGFRGEGEASFRSWLGTIAGHVVQDQARKLRAKKGDVLREVSLDAEVAGPGGERFSLEDALRASADSPSQALRRDERFERLKKVLATLRPDHSRVIYLARVEGLPMKEVARQMGRTPEAASMLLLRALLKLKEAFGNTDSFHLPPRTLLEEEDSRGERA